MSSLDVPKQNISAYYQQRHPAPLNSPLDWCGNAGYIMFVMFHGFRVSFQWSFKYDQHE